ncbi:MAG: serine hydrolase, partial [Acidobacteria bacterium]|nr:serine hydrolase [Acidobacteriota bacterium]
YQDVYRVDLETGARTLAVKKMLSFTLCPLCLQPSADGGRFLYYDEGQYLVYDMASGRSTNITRTVPTSFIDSANDMTPAVKPPVPPVGWVKDGGAVLLSDDWDIWNVPVGGGSATNLTVSGRKEGVHYRWLPALDPEEKGIDLSLSRYLGMYGERTKKNGIGRLDPGKTGVQVLLWDDAEFSRVLKATRADVYLYTKETYKDPPDYYVTDGMLKAGRKVTDLDAQVKPFAWSSGSQIVEYTAVLGKGGKPQKLQASLFLPANYQKGKAYPTIVRLYEKQSQNHNQFYPPRTTGTGFNKSTYTSNGYAVLMPDIVYNVNDPGMSAVWCVISAVQAAIKTGVVDPKRIGLHGHSWGGYQTAFLITQTDMFAAAAAGAPLTDLVSFYSSLFKNRGGSNQPLFENNQARFSGGYWDYRDAFIRNSPVFAARNVKTPLLLNHNDKDGAVDFNQGLEYYNTLRRLGKNVVMLEYVGENHNMAKEANRQDYIVRMKEFFDHYLMDRPAPDWLSKGVPRLEMEDHLDRRMEQPQRPAKPATAKPTATDARPEARPQLAAAPQRPDLAARVDAVFAQWAKPNSAGCAVAVIKDGAIVYEKGYGMSNLEYDLPITPASVFNIASVSKQFTAMAVMVLVSQGKVALDDEARKYVKELPDFGTPVTIRHLLTHTSGLREQMGLLNL